MGRASYFKNPMWSVAVNNRCRFHVELMAPKEVTIGLQLVQGPKGGQRVDSIAQGEEVCSSYDYRPGFCYAEIDALAPGLYTLVASTFKEGQHASFIIKVFSSSPLQHLRAIPPEGDGMKTVSMAGQWSDAAGTAVGCNNHGHYIENPCYQILCNSRTKLIVRLGSDRGIATNVTCFRATDAGRLPPSASPLSPLAVATSNKGIYTDAGGALGAVSLDPGLYYVVPSSFYPYNGAYNITFHTDPAASISRTR